MALQAAAAVFSVYSYGQQQRSAKAAQAAQTRQFQASEQKAEIQNVRRIRSQIRQNRLASGQMLNVGAQMGGLGSSTLAGGLSSLRAQTSGNLGYLTDIAAANTKIGQAGLQAATSMSDAALYGQVGDIGMTIFGQTGGYQKAAELFSKKEEA